MFNKEHSSLGMCTRAPRISGLSQVNLDLAADTGELVFDYKE